MKNYLILVLTCFIAFTNCSDNDTPAPVKIVEIYWSLTNVSGGIAGTDEDFPLNTIKWRFDEVNNILNVENDNTDDTKPDGLDSGDYDYSVLTENNQTFLVIDSNEIGRFTVTQTQLIIDENDTSVGTGADGYVYTFSKVTIVE